MNVNEALEADWIQIRTILKAQAKRLENTPAADTLIVEARKRANHWIAECEKIILSYSVKHN